MVLWNVYIVFKFKELFMKGLKTRFFFKFIIMFICQSSVQLSTVPASYPLLPVFCNLGAMSNLFFISSNSRRGINRLNNLKAVNIITNTAIPLSVFRPLHGWWGCVSMYYFIVQYFVASSRIRVRTKILESPKFRIISEVLEADDFAKFL